MVDKITFLEANELCFSQIVNKICTISKADTNNHKCTARMVMVATINNMAQPVNTINNMALTGNTDKPINNTVQTGTITNSNMDNNITLTHHNHPIILTITTKHLLLLSL